MKSRADERFEAELQRTGARDPREFYRERLKGLKERNPDGFRRATAYYHEVLVPEVAREDSDPIGAWLEYGRLLATLWTEGSTVQIDPSGRSWPYQVPVPRDHLVLHLPVSTREGALPVGLPVTLSEAQRATYELLVRKGG